MSPTGCPMLQGGGGGTGGHPPRPLLQSHRGCCPTWALAVRSSRCCRVMAPRASLWSLSQGSWSPGPSWPGAVGAAKERAARERRPRPRGPCTPDTV